MLIGRERCIRKGIRFVLFAIYNSLTGGCGERALASSAR